MVLLRPSDETPKYQSLETPKSLLNRLRRAEKKVNARLWSDLYGTMCLQCQRKCCKWGPDM
jgi:hypothetical protein